MVMLYHSQLPFAAGGFVGVDVFFVLSGYLITGLLMNEWNRTGTIALRDFFARRALRLLPALFLLLGAALAVPTLVRAPEGRAVWEVVLIVLVYMSNWFLAQDIGSLGTLTPTWSLSIEEQFYLVWPPLLVLLLKWCSNRRWLVGLVALGVIAVWGERLVLALGLDARTPRLYYGTDTRADGLLLGSLVGVLAAQGMLPTKGRALDWAQQAALPALVTLVFLGYRARIGSDGGLSWSVLASLAAASLLVSLLTSPPRLVRAFLELAVLVWIGRISYGLYLWHVPVFHGLLRTDSMLRWGLTGVTVHLLRFGTTFFVAIVSFTTIERPMLKLKRHFRGSGVRVQKNGSP